GVRVGQVTGIETSETGATVTIEVVEDQALHDNTRLVMRYADLLGQRYLGLVQPTKRGAELEGGATIPEARTDPGFDLTELLNGFKPLFEVLQPGDVNTLATSLVRVLQGEGGTVEGLLQQTAELTDFVADRDQVIGEVMTNLTPVLDNLAGQGTEIRRTVLELRDLMTGLARDRRSIGSSIDGISQLVGATSALLREVRVPLTRTSDRLATVAEMFAGSRSDLDAALPAFADIFEALGRATSYENALNVYVCSFAVSVAGGPPLNLAGDDGPWSEVCRG
ncbi:MAG TPA: MlaD family protein, partial [Nocardioides sp.]|nr:MlaD family protein [Nocardioides sp.]